MVPNLGGMGSTAFPAIVEFLMVGDSPLPLPFWSIVLITIAVSDGMRSMEIYEPEWIM